MAADTARWEGTTRLVSTIEGPDPDPVAEVLPAQVEAGREVVLFVGDDDGIVPTGGDRRDR